MTAFTITKLSLAGASNIKTYASANALGRSARIPTVISNDIPLPIPLCVICSPSHIKINEPVVKKTIELRRKILGDDATTMFPSGWPSKPGSAGLNPWIKLPGLSRRATANSPPWIIQIIIVRYRVYCAIFCRPGSPSC